MHSGSIGGPTKWNPDDYTMVTIWESESSLEKFAGKNWNQASYLSRYKNIQSLLVLHIMKTCDLHEQIIVPRN
jgi:hypothetical protein